MEMQGAQPVWVSALRILLQITLALFFVLTSVRLLLTKGFVRLEYALPGFPADPYGFTKTDRIHYADLSLEYLLNDQGIDFLGDLTLADGSPLYNSRELRHMSDVKQVTRSALQVWIGSGVAAVVLAAALWQLAGVQELVRGLRSGAILTVGVMLVLIVGLVLGFSVLFVGFHRVFFEGNTWLFEYSDSLIRLFPERFWQVAFGTIAVATLAMGGVLYAIAGWLGSRAA